MSSTPSHSEIIGLKINVDVLEVGLFGFGLLAKMAAW